MQSMSSQAKLKERSTRLVAVVTALASRGQGSSIPPSSPLPAESKRRRESNSVHKSGNSEMSVSEGLDLIPFSSATDNYKHGTRRIVPAAP